MRWCPICSKKRSESEASLVLETNLIKSKDSNPHDQVIFLDGYKKTLTFDEYGMFVEIDNDNSFSHYFKKKTSGIFNRLNPYHG